ncbi:protein phosphatase 1 regulatory inhibitor subunit PPP1R7 homolog isoform X2 [Physcomitrium patens]|uniref:Protein phosphatase 1 regulatory subunit 7 n=1 Tax=Physcomitrium patens TaxID=3218 RepID=A9T0S3_PHYPA|nr:protein phosphatase 1 regulatory inhibitor subunit PPP1R7 homolog isoform X2 [Physcomitrium patens]PNR63365.1 hypothetical protein PHYPA_001791 [Physcomitrium patens]|eukprot:XP_024389521.1 protein phosphatase 1 regulatory inhibitor subunit PPP1R7 homolog isoform X2 [Physcomitrella patens]
MEAVPHSQAEQVASSASSASVLASDGNRTEAGEAGGEGERILAKEEKILDLTSFQLHDLTDVDLPSFLEELDLTANRLTSIDPRISNLSHLQKLSFEQNLLADSALTEFNQFTTLKGLKELVLRDNKLLKIPGLSTFVELLLLDVSFNKVSSMNGLSDVSSSLTELYLSNNEIEKIVEMEHLTNLRVLELGSNKIRVMERLDQLKELQQLWLGRNRIQSVNLCGLTGLLKISVQNNRLTSMAAFQDCVNLTELYLSHNHISVMEGLSTLQNLRVLDLSSNKITEISNLEELIRLEDLWLNDNSISSLDDIEMKLAGCKNSLTTIYLERNPCALDPKYMRTMRAILPKLQQLDSHLLLH